MVAPDETDLGALCNTSARVLSGTQRAASVIVSELM